MPSNFCGPTALRVLFRRDVESEIHALRGGGVAAEQIEAMSIQEITAIVDRLGARTSPVRFSDDNDTPVSPAELGLSLCDWAAGREGCYLVFIPDHVVVVENSVVFDSQVETGCHPARHPMRDWPLVDAMAVTLPAL